MTEVETIQGKVEETLVTIGRLRIKQDEGEPFPRIWLDDKMMEKVVSLVLQLTPNNLPVVKVEYYT